MVKSYQEVYLCKFKDIDYVKIGCASISDLRLCEIGIPEWYIVVKHNNPRFLEGLIHNALSEYRIPRFVIDRSEGSTEFFMCECVDKFLKICKELNLEYMDKRCSTTYTKKIKKFSNFKTKHENLVDSYLKGYSDAIK